MVSVSLLSPWKSDGGRVQVARIQGDERERYEGSSCGTTGPGEDKLLWRRISGMRGQARSSMKLTAPGASTNPVHDLNVPYQGPETPTADLLFHPILSHLHVFPAGVTTQAMDNLLESLSNFDMFGLDQFRSIINRPRQNPQLLLHHRGVREISTFQTRLEMQPLSYLSDPDPVHVVMPDYVNGELHVSLSGEQQTSILLALESGEALKCELLLVALARIWRIEDVTKDNRLSTTFDEVSVYPISAALYLVKNLLQYYIFAYVDAPGY
ncbi:hypothetical protein L2E82_17102 [Cichorium intybus]|uniref:Uncharacterized protein n=1 Tax=Cichorium intybus TaxID=13427 RepID=A0ACB9F8N0_CICIN|nr:hypothetical protein L2E82_17102 [Cichorium intybus]